TSMSGLYATSVTSGAASQASSKLYIVIASHGQTSAHKAQPMHLSYSMIARLFGSSGLDTYRMASTTASLTVTVSQKATQAGELAQPAQECRSMIGRRFGGFVRT